MKTKRIFNRILVTVAAFLIMLFVGFESTLSIPAKAEETYSITAETKVADDLNYILIDGKKAFDTADYPEKADDYSLTVLTIAEGADKGLFIYVYQPSTNTKFLQSINLSMSTLPTGDENAEWRLYTLDMLDEYGAIQKYKVDNFEVSTDSVRFYDITRISRIFDSDIDTPEMLDESQTINLVAVEVATCWEVKTVDGKLTYLKTPIDVIEITNAWTGHITYSDGFFGSVLISNCDAWFFALSTDMRIDELIEADVVYSYIDYSYRVPPTGNDELVEVKTESNVLLRLNDKQTGSNQGNGLFGHKWTWDRIVPISEFVEDNGDNLSEDCKNKLSSDDFKGGWVLRYLETENYNYYLGEGLTSTYYHDYTNITEVSVLRLKFKTDGETYNLGVVSDTYDPDQIPDGEYGILDGVKAEFDAFFKRLQEIFGEFFNAIKGVIVILIVCLFGGVIIGLFSFLSPVLKVLFKGIWAVICLPFKLIGKLFKRGKKR